MENMKIFIAADHAGWKRKNQILNWLQNSFKPEFDKNNLENQGCIITDLSVDFEEGDDYPNVAKKISDSLDKCRQTGLQNTCFGIALCGTGQGICMALNRFSFIRAGVSVDKKVVELMRAHNNANVLCLPGLFYTDKEIFNAVEVFLKTASDPEKRHLRRVNELSGF